MNFNIFKTAVAKQFAMMQKESTLFRTNVEKDVLWETYQSSFPEGTNPVYRERREYDCNCCKQFIRVVGNVVAIIDGKLVSIWDISIPSEPNFQIVADALSNLNKSAKIQDTFYHYERTVGTDKNFEDQLDGVKTWEHFFANLDNKFVKNKDNIPSLLGELRENKNVFLRSLTELSEISIDDCLDLILQKSLHRGEEKEFAIRQFRNLQQDFLKLSTESEKELFAWKHATSKQYDYSIIRIKNDVIGTFLSDVSEGMDLLDAVERYGKKVAGDNYKRPKTLATKQMLEIASKVISDLGLTSALQRRFVNPQDISVNNVKFVDRGVRDVLADSGNIFDDLASKSPVIPKNFDNVQEITIEEFISKTLPTTKSLEVLFENRLQSNLVSLTTAKDPTCNRLFKWDNNFGWSYNGNYADSLVERVKIAGGKTEGDLCCRLAWDYTDDLDFHMFEPNGYHIYYSKLRQKSPNGGVLDTDANGMDGMRDKPIENIVYENRKTMKEGDYKLRVKNYARRSGGDGFEVEIEFDGQKHNIVYNKSLKDGEHIDVATINYSKLNGFSIKESLPSQQTSKNIWGLQTQTFQKVSLVTLSPNYWDEKCVGNKHYFFMIDKCKNDGSARGFYNEFLRSDLEPHRKSFEMAGAKLVVEDIDNQLSGIGISSTQKNHLIVKVTSSFTRVLKIVF